MKAKKIEKTTTNRYVYNRNHKRYLECRGELNCSYCFYHSGENYDKKWYGDRISNKKEDIRYPNWKLVSKNKKQWQKKPIKIITRTIMSDGGYSFTVTEIRF